MEPYILAQFMLWRTYFYRDVSVPSKEKRKKRVI